MSTQNQPDQGVGTFSEGSEPTRATPTVGPPPTRGSGYDPDDPYAQDPQRERFGGINWGAGFFGWLIAVAVAALLSGIAGAVVTALGRADQVMPAANGSPGPVGIAAAAILFGVLILAYFAGGYVAGRMSRFDGGRQGVGVWIVGLAVLAAVVGLGLTLGRQYGLLDGVNLPSMPQGRALDIRALIAAGAALLCTLLAAIAGGKVGCRYHRKVDEAALD